MKAERAMRAMDASSPSRAEHDKQRESRRFGSLSRLVDMTSYPRAEAAERAGVGTEFLDRLIDLGIVAPDELGGCSPADVRRVLLAKSLEQAGIPLDSVAAALQRGALSLTFLDEPSYERFAALSTETFQQVSDRTGIPLDLLTVSREAIGMAQPTAADRLREDDMTTVPVVGLRPAG